jgi:hypothetical protein
LLPDETFTAAKLELIRIAESMHISSPSSKEDVTNEYLAERRQAISSLDKPVSSHYNKIAEDADANDLEVTLRVPIPASYADSPSKLYWKTAC